MEKLREEILREMEFKKLFEEFRFEAFKLRVNLKAADPKDVFSDLAHWLVKEGYYIQKEIKK